MNPILQIFLGIIICVLIMLIGYAYTKYEDKKEEARRCLECGQIPLKPDPRFDAGRISCDKAFLDSGHFVRCSCGELKRK